MTKLKEAVGVGGGEGILWLALKEKNKIFSKASGYPTKVCPLDSENDLRTNYFVSRH